MKEIRFMYRFTVLTIVSCMLFSLASCGSDDDDTENIVKIESNNNNNADNGAECGNGNNADNTNPTPVTVNGHECVDLGLSVKWATCNVGASSPSDYGDYFAWGEITTKAKYTNENSITSGKVFGDISGNSQYDAARANWGGSWRMPSITEFRELNEKCTWTWTTQDGNNGYKVTGHNGNSIFLPAASFRYYASLYDAGSSGCYWSSTCESSMMLQLSWNLYFYNSHHSMTTDIRHYGFTVRPVSE